MRSSTGPADFAALGDQAGEASARPCQWAKRKRGCCQASRTTGWSSAAIWRAASLLPGSFPDGFSLVFGSYLKAPSLRSLPPSQCVLGDSAHRWGQGLGRWPLPIRVPGGKSRRPVAAWADVPPPCVSMVACGAGKR